MLCSTTKCTSLNLAVQNEEVNENQFLTSLKTQFEKRIHCRWVIISTLCQIKDLFFLN